MSFFVENILKNVPVSIEKTVDFSGTWTNNLGSTMTLTQKANQLTGTYKNVASNINIDVPATGDLIGFANGNLISFVVNWRTLNSTTAWVGHIDPNDDKKINTLWHLIRGTKPAEEWESINTGCDFFNKESTK